MQKIKVTELKEHPMNTFYFDNMSGEKWNEFLKSVETSGVIEPIIVNQEKIIISGHQRYRACIELSIEEVLCDIRIYDNEQQEIKDLIETNIRQRGDISSSSLKMGRIIKALEDCYGIQHGGDRKSNPPMVDLKSQKDIAEQLGINQESYRRTKKLLELIPELQELLEQGELSASVGSRILARLSPEEQKEVLEDLGADGLSEKTQTQLKEYIHKLHEQEQENQKLKQALEQERNNPKEKEYIEKIVEIDNTDYNLKNKLNTLQDKLNEKEKELLKTEDKTHLLQKELYIYKQDSLEYEKFKNDIETLTKTKEDLGRQINGIKETTRLVSDIEDFLKEKLAPVRYSKSILDCKNEQIVIENLTEIINMVENWCYEIKNIIPNSNNFVEGMVIE